MARSASAPSQEAEPSSSSPSGPASRLDRRRIALVDDDEIVLRSTAGLLRREGYEVACYADASTALAAIQEGEFDLCVLDVRMPGMSGLELLGRIREVEQTQDRIAMPVVVLTGYADERTPIQALRLKADDYLLKPFERTEFLASVRKHIDERRSRAQERDYQSSLERRFEDALVQLDDSREKLAQAGKLAAVGQLGTNVAHELASPLTAIIAYADLIMHKLQLPDGGGVEVERCIRVIGDEAQRCAAIVRNLLSFSRRTPPRFEAVAIPQVLDRTLSLLRHSLERNGIAAIVDFPPVLPPVLGDADQLQQVFTNLIVNARDAMPKGGELRIAAAVFAAAEENDCVELAFQDSGCGIPGDHLDRVFEPFFSTSEGAKAMGLGLSICRQVIELHHGTIEVESEVGEGTTFTICLNAYRPGSATPA